MTSRLPPIPCETCGAPMWPRGSRRHCTPSKLEWRAEDRVYVPHADALVKLNESALVAGRQLMLRDERERSERAARLASIRAAQSAKQRRAEGLPA